jgi:hypothetical protein
MKLLPGGRFYHVDISAQGIAVRRAWKIEQVAWPEVSPFGISVRTKSTKGGKVTTHWVVALRASDAGSLADEAERYKRSVLKIDAGEYGSSKAADAAEALVVWLNGIRTEAIERRGRVGETVRVPPDFNAVALASGTGITGAVAAAAKRSSVIER